MARRLVLIALLVLACTHDVVLPNTGTTDTCGDGVVGPDEECDPANPSPGCTNCLVTPGWKCVDNNCFYPCGDGISGDGQFCQNATKDTACDMTGWWLARENDSVVDAILGAPQPASTWYLYRFTQSGPTFQIEQAIHCGFHVTGSATVDYTPGSIRGLLYENDPTVSGPHPRYGTFQLQGSACTFTFNRHYRIRGGQTPLLPADFTTHPALSTLPPLPYEDDPLHPTGQHLQYQEDTDGDGWPGIASQITGLASGIRESTQRDFKEYATSPPGNFVPGGETVPPNSIQFTVHGNWDLQESVLEVHDCGESADGGEGVCGLIKTPGNPNDARFPPRITMRYLGSTLTSPRVASVVLSDPGVSADLDVETCANVRIALPHDPVP